MARDIEVHLGDNILEHGECLENDVVLGRLYGKPGAPLIVIRGGISASRYLADNKENGHGWWTDLVYPGGPIDLEQYQVLGLDLAPTGKNTQKRVTITTHDQAKRLGALLDHLEIETAHAAIGTSYGAMVLLAFAEQNPERFQKQCLLGASHRPYPMGVAWRGIERRAIELGIAAGDINSGLKIARELAMTTYRSAEEFSIRFAGQQISSDPRRFDVDGYLESCGEKYHEIMPAMRFLALSESIDLHEVDPSKVTTPTLLVATNSDQLAPPSEIELLHQLLSGPSELVTIDSIYGHDSFLKEYDVLGPLISDFVQGERRAA
ncbi:MAG: homoserine O-succinyltransferase [Acidimicrobiales bacterium]|nr:homoserine O-succinyltransferase [Hyphomonadaceae bacterium]RZV44555.1 MAG: homoserine O-succinyltransferase [Acidimicrobiales bacterium]